MHGIRLVGLCVLAGGCGLLLYYGVFAGVGRAVRAAGLPETVNDTEKVAKTKRQTEGVMRHGVLPCGVALVVVGALLMAF